MSAVAEPQALGAEEFRALLEERIKARFGLTLAEFLEAFESGELDDDPAATDYAILVGAPSSAE